MSARGSGNADNNSFNPLEKCRELKKTYDKCFKNWYSSKFLKGDIEMGDQCEEEFEALQVCINKAVDARKKSHVAST